MAFAIPLRAMEFEARDGGDGGQGFAPETEARQMAQVISRAHLAGGVALQGQVQIVPAHAAAIIGDFQQALAAFLKPRGRLLVIARSRPNPAAPEGPPWPLARKDIDALAANGLTLESCEEVSPSGEPAHWRALYRRAA